MKGSQVVLTPQAAFRNRCAAGADGTANHNANMVFATAAAAVSTARIRATTGVVQVVVGADEFDRLFTSRNSLTADRASCAGRRGRRLQQERQVSIDELVWA
jgi:hypothetical protein